MRRVLWMVVMAGLAGCQGLVGPFQRASRPVPVDDPRLTLEEQKVRGRDRLAYPEGDSEVGPPTYAGLPGRGGY